MSDELATAYPPGVANRETTLIKTRRTEAKIKEDLPRVGLALSGGGIRSATFGLGLIRALAASGLLRRIDFLSTVSGGGYVGSFLGALFAREKAAGIEDGDRPETVQAALTAPSSWLLGWLRENGRYLSPNGSGDTLLAAAVMLRNWLAVQAVIGTAVLALFVAADFVGATVAGDSVRGSAVVARIWWSPWIVLPPMVFAAWVVPCAWAFWLLRRPGRGWSWSTLSVPLVMILFLPALRDHLSDLLHFNLRAIRDVFVAAYHTAFAGQVTGIGAWVERTFVLSEATDLVVWLQNLVLLSAVVTVAFIGMGWLKAWFDEQTTQRKLSVWLRSGLLVTAALAVLAVLDSLGQTLYALLHTNAGLWRWLAPIPAATMALVPFAQKLLAVFKPADGARRSRVFPSALVLVGGLLFASFFAVMVAAVGDSIAWNSEKPPAEIMARLVNTPPSSADGGATNDPSSGGAGATDRPSNRHGGSALLVLGALCFCLGSAFSFLNDSTLAPLYAARLRRAYLGASNSVRETDGRRRAVTNDVEGDEISLAEYHPWVRGGPLHLLNVTLNETTGGTSQIEQRDRRGLGLAFGPAGISVGVQHHALWRDENAAGDFAAGLTPVPLPEHFAVFCAGEDGTFAPEALSLSRIVAISGAAVSTGLGSRTSLGMSLALGLLNLRLGHWWYSGVDPRNREPVSWLRHPWRAASAALRRRVSSWFGRSGSTKAPNPAPSEKARSATQGVGSFLGAWLSRHLPVQAHLLHELLARFPGPASRNWYLSDGGHFENSACYELIRRRLPLIIVSDCGADHEYEFSDFAQLVRKARLDFGAEIRPATTDELGKLLDSEVRRFFASPGLLHSAKGERLGIEPIDDRRRWNGGHALLCFVTYDDSKERSILLWIKPSLLGSEPADILNYAIEHESFPQEPTSDQFFDEAQWESYQRLGLLIGQRIFGGDHPSPLPAKGWHPCSLDPKGLEASADTTPSRAGDSVQGFRL